MLTNLEERLSVNAAYTHANIAPSTVVNVIATTIHGITTVKALATPWYSVGDVLRHVKTCPTVNKLVLVNRIIVVSKHHSWSCWPADWICQGCQASSRTWRGARCYPPGMIRHDPEFGCLSLTLSSCFHSVQCPCQQWRPCRISRRRRPHHGVSTYFPAVLSPPHSAICQLQILWATLPRNGFLGPTHNVYGCLLFRYDSMGGDYFIYLFKIQSLIGDNFTRYSQERNLFLISQGSAQLKKSSWKSINTVTGVLSNPATWVLNYGWFCKGAWRPTLCCVRQWAKL